jgi:hypothetical protein
MSNIYNMDDTQTIPNINKADTETVAKAAPIRPTQKAIELGDIIQIVSPSNTELDGQAWAVSYLDETKIRIIHTGDYHEHTLDIDDNGELTDESIQEIAILCRCDEKGFARQNELVTNTWIDIHFGGEIPTVISGEITNLEEDMIEITTYPNRKVLYIDFEYKGMPESVPIERIVLRDRPSGIEHTIAKPDDLELEPGEIEEEAFAEYTDEGELLIRIPENAEPELTIDEELRKYYLQARGMYEESLGTEYNEVEVPESERRYTLEAQLIDLTDELVSTYPVLKRNPRVFGLIHNLVHKFRQLRQQFSVIDDTETVVNPKRTSALDKPLAKRLENMDAPRIHWIVPTVRLDRRLYTTSDEPPIEEADVENASIYDFMVELQEIQDKFSNEVNGANYSTYMSELEAKLAAYRPPIVPRNTIYHTNVKGPIEGIVNNFEGYASTSMKKEGNVRRKYTTQRFERGAVKSVSQEMRSGKHVFVRENIVPNDRIDVASLVVLPEQFIQYSRVNLPGTRIIDRAWLSQETPMMYRIFRSKTRIEPNYIDNLSQKSTYGALSASDDDSGSAFFGSRLKIKEYLLNPSLAVNDTTFHQFLTAIIPEKQLMVDFAKKRITGTLSIYDMIRYMEPFSIYATDITFSQYNNMRYFVKEGVKQHKAEFRKKQLDYERFRVTQAYASTDEIDTMFYTQKLIENTFRECYGIMHSSKNHRTSSESLYSIYSVDGAHLFLALVNKLMLSLITPDKILNSVEVAKLDDMTNMEKIRATDCFRRYIVKKYTSIDALRKDNNNDEVFYDKEYDDTPYDIIKKYKDKKKELLPESFVEFLRHVLVEKHECPENMSQELAETLIRGKKLVKDGYAILELRPELPEKEKDSPMSPTEREGIEIEAEAKLRLQYYKRINGHWVRDDTVDETSFIDNNMLMCNMSRECIQTTPSKVCAPNDTAATRMKAATMNRMLKEFDERFSMSLNEIESNLDTFLRKQEDEVARRRILTMVMDRKHNDYAVSLGKRAVQVENVESPHEPLRRMIMAQTDFVRRQTDILRFVDAYTREPMLDYNEDPYWLYCQQTNTKLIPLSLCQLAKAFVHTNTYAQTLDRLCSEVGVLSEDGDCIIDKHTHCVLRQIDFVAEEGYDEAGFRVITGAVMEKDIGEALNAELNDKDKVFDTEEKQYAYNVFKTISKHIGMNRESVEDTIEEFVLRTTLEMMNTTDIVLSEKSYLKRLEKRAKESKDKPMVPYVIYRGQILILCVACATTIGLMTTIPTFKTKKTFPGCVQSFRGFPVDAGDEDLSGIKYIACILSKSKSSIPPWNAIESWSVNTLVKRMKEFISGQMMPRPDIAASCQEKREYLLIHPDTTVPRKLDIARWVHFMPPLVEFTVGKTGLGVGEGFEGELFHAIRESSKSQHVSIGILKSKIVGHTFGVVELIRQIVGKKEMLLTTAAKYPFLENACCNEDIKRVHPISYFIQEDAQIREYLKHIRSFSDLLRRVRILSTPQMMFHRENTTLQRGTVSTSIDDRIVYGAMIHYCNFDRNIPIPPEFEAVCSEKPAVYDRLDTLETKIEKMKANGIRYTTDTLEHLMSIVNRSNLVSSNMGVRCTETFQVDAFKDVLENLELSDSEVVESPLRKLILKTLREYNPRLMVHEERDSNDELNRYLRVSNGRMYAKITEFIDQRGNLTTGQYDKIQVFLHEICNWKIDTTPSAIYRIQRFVYNFIEQFVNVYPSVIQNRANPVLVPKHWELDGKHIDKLSGALSVLRTQLFQFHQNRSIEHLFESIRHRLSPLILFVRSIPIFSPIVKAGVEYYSLYSKDTTYLLLKYCWYSVLYEFILGTEDPDIITFDRRMQIARRRENTDDIFGVDSDEEEDENVLYEVELNEGDITKVKNDACKLLLVALQYESSTKATIDMTIDEFKFKNQRKRDKEKKQITDAFERMEKNERSVENMLKQFKIGRWNVGMQKSLFNYNGETYNRQQELNQYLNQDDVDEGDITLHMVNAETGVVSSEVEDLERAEVYDANAEYDEEANGISNLDEDYTDGNYYGEDDEF